MEFGMKATFFQQGGSANVLHHGDIPFSGQCEDHQVLVRIKAIGINPIDYKIRSAPDRFPVTFPVIPGCDGAGVVEAVGRQVGNCKPGDNVYFSQPGFNHRQGTYAEYALVDAHLVAMKPASLTFEQAAAVPLVAITAWEALYDRARLSSGQTVLIHAGAGGVGHIAIQLAKWAGASVATTVSNDEKADFVRRLGADKIINYRTQNVTDEIMQWTEHQGVDVAFDTVGGSVLQQCFSCVKCYGDVVTILQPSVDTNWSDARLRNVRFSFELMLTPVLLELEDAKSHQADILRQCAPLFDDNQLSVQVARVFDLADAAIAQQCLERDHPMGKLVLAL